MHSFTHWTVVSGTDFCYLFDLILRRDHLLIEPFVANLTGSVRCRGSPRNFRLSLWLPKNSLPSTDWLDQGLIDISYCHPTRKDFLKTQEQAHARAHMQVFEVWFQAMKR